MNYKRNNRQSKSSSSQQNRQITTILTILIIFSGWIAIKNRLSQPNANSFPLNSPNEIITATKKKAIPASIPTEQDLQIYQGNYQQLDQIARNINYTGSSVKELAEILSQYANTEAEKARIIYVWITHNITYDVVSFLNKNYPDASPTIVLKNRLAVCSGYANLYQALAERMGLHSAIIIGYAKGLDYLVGDSSEANHAWNSVKINNSWYLIDTTWGAGTVNNNEFQRKFNSQYFATPPQQLIYSHFPEESSWQLLPTVYNRQQFNSWPIVTPQFFRDGIKFVNQTSYNIQSSGMTSVILQIPSATQISAQLQQNNVIIQSHTPLIQTVNGQTIIQVSFPSAGTYDLLIFSKNKSDKNNFIHALSYRITANASGAATPKTYSIFEENNAYLHSPTTAKLNKNQLVNFKIEVPNALDVVIIDESSGKWTPLSKSGNLFFGNVKIGTGKITIAGKFAEGNRYSSLVEYE
jgi:transglutaminase/protease-like cytokinesis protein 3